MFDDVDERRLGPLQIVDDEHSWSLSTKGLEHLAYRPTRFLVRDGSARRLEQVADALGGVAGVGSGTLQQVTLAQRLDEWPPRQSTAIGQAAAHRNGRRAVDRLQDLGHQA